VQKSGSSAGQVSSGSHVAQASPPPADVQLFVYWGGGKKPTPNQRETEAMCILLMLKISDASKLMQ